MLSSTGFACGIWKRGRNISKKRRGGLYENGQNSKRDICGLTQGKQVERRPVYERFEGYAMLSREAFILDGRRSYALRPEEICFNMNMALARDED